MRRCSRIFRTDARASHGSTGGPGARIFSRVRVSLSTSDPNTREARTPTGTHEGPRGSARPLRGVRAFSRALCRRNLGSMKDAACLGQHCSAGTRRSAHGFPDSPDPPNHGGEDGTSKVWPRANCAPSSEGLGSSLVHCDRLPPRGYPLTRTRVRGSHSEVPDSTERARSAAARPNCG